MLIAHTGDTHIDSDTHGGIGKSGLNRAWESHARALRSAVDEAISRKADAFLHCGDAFKNGRPSQEAVLLFAECLSPLADAGIPILLLDGNHERLQVPTSQRTATATVAGLLRGEVHLVEREPRLVTFNSGLQVAALPWLSKTTILTRLGEEKASPREGDQLVVEFALKALNDMCDAAKDGPLILASHVTLDDVRIDSLAKGAKRGSEVDIAHVFAEPILPRNDIEDSPVTYAALSHIHARQRIGTKCFYAGSPDAITMTDADEDKSINFVELDDTTGELLGLSQFTTEHRAMTRIDLNMADAEDKIDALTEGTLVGLVLAPGDAMAPESIRDAIRDAGALVVSSRRTPKDRDKAAVSSLPERTGPLDALRAWCEDRGADEADVSTLIGLAGSLMDEEVAS